VCVCVCVCARARVYTYSWYLESGRGDDGQGFRVEG